MANLVAVLALSGQGKSSSIGKSEKLGIKGLDPSTTYLINTIDKPLPFKGWRKLYNAESKNYVTTRDPAVIAKLLVAIDGKPSIKAVVIDDFQYIMSGKFMDDAKVKGYDKFTDLAKQIWDLLETARSLRPDLTIFILSHAEEYADGGQMCMKFKTIGKLLDEKVVLEGLFTTVLYGEGAIEGNVVKKWFRTQSSGTDTCKSPADMFPDIKIPNDLGYVLECVQAYDN